jgi:hypothetical protein
VTATFMQNLPCGIIALPATARKQTLSLTHHPTYLFLSEKTTSQSPKSTVK